VKRFPQPWVNVGGRVTNGARGGLPPSYGNCKKKVRKRGKWQKKGGFPGGGKRFEVKRGGP